MVKLIKKEITTKKISYYYDPEEEGQLGIVNYYPEEDRVETEKISEMEDEQFAYWRRHAWTALREFYDKKEYPEEKIIIWG